MGNENFEHIVGHCGLSRLFAARAVTLACQRAGVEPDAVQRSNIEAVLGEVASTTEKFLERADHAETMRALRQHFGVPEPAEAARMHSP